MPEPVLLVDVELTLAAWEGDLRAHGFAPVIATDWAGARRHAEQHDKLLVLTAARGQVPVPEGIALSHEFPGMQLVLCVPASERAPVLPALEEGDFEFLARSDNLTTVLGRLRRAARVRDTRLELERLRRHVENQRGYEGIVGTSAPMQELFALIERAATTRASVLITGESGTGKELVARALHQRGARVQGPFVAINCSAVPATLLESELFGHVKGAFTDARESRPGLFAKAHGGTLFLEELGEMPLVLHPKSLRVPQERAVRAVGADVEMAIDVRLVTATNIDIDEAVARGAFREDLFYRLNVIRINVPPLRERASDVLFLAEHFIRASAAEQGKDVHGVSRAAARRLLSYAWPGNVRELQNCIERAVALTRDDEIQLGDLPDKVRAAVTMVAEVARPDELVPLDEIERRYIVHVLRAVGDNKKMAARVLGLDRKTLYRKLERYRLLEVSRGE